MSQPLHALLVEDSADDAALLVKELQRGSYAVTHEVLATAEALRVALAREAWDVILCDYRMPGFSGSEALTMVRAAGYDVPFIFVSGTMGEDLAVEAMKQGAHDYVMKGNLKRLVPAIERELREAAVRRERRQAEEQLRRSQERLKEAQRVGRLGYFDWDLKTNELVLSEEALAIYRLDRDQPIRTLEEILVLVPPDERARVGQSLVAAAAGGARHDLEHRMVRPDGQVIVVRATAEMFRDPAGNPERVLVTILDITERKQLEERVRQSQKMEAIGHLAGGIAHEFNNILAAMMMGLDLVRVHNQTPESLNLLGEIEGLSHRAANLVKQLLAFSRQSMIKRQPLELAAVVAEQGKMLNRLLGERVSLALGITDNRTWVNADKSSLEQVLLNLCLNARDAMKTGGTLSIDLADAEVSAAVAATHREVQSGKFVCLSVSDTGCGMGPEILERLFEPFFTTKDVGKGTGLGLATVRGLVEQHHGWVEAESRVGKGSTFRVYLPAVAPPLTDLTVAPEAGLVKGEGTILLVEDEAALREAEKRLLTHSGYHVLPAADVNEALALWNQHRAVIDLLFTDMVMPGKLTGLQIAERVVAEKPGVKVIITTGYNADLLELGKDADSPIVYLPKPCAPANLTRVIQKCLQRP